VAGAAGGAGHPGTLPAARPDRCRPAAGPGAATALPAAVAGRHTGRRSRPAAVLATAAAAWPVRPAANLDGRFRPGTDPALVRPRPWPAAGVRTPAFHPVRRPQRAAGSIFLRWPGRPAAVAGPAGCRRLAGLAAASAARRTTGPAAAGLWRHYHLF